MIRVFTENSAYDLEFINGPGGIPIGGRIRYAEGAGPTESLSPRGEWKEFHAISVLEVGKAIQIIWPPDSIHTATLTSWVQRIEEQ